MRFTETGIRGAFIIETEPIEDERGFFARTWCAKEFSEHGLNSKLVQCNVSYNRKKGTLRGMHYQEKPNGETKLVSCISGAVYDVIADVRPESPTFGKWISVELSSANRKMLYIPEGVAHGFQSLEDNTTVFYQMSEFYYPESARGIRWDDKKFFFVWPLEKKIISRKDREWKNYGV